ncbi:MAG: hypothetical protein WC418_06620, partial [Candidatus Omnitrophota bacterium]
GIYETLSYDARANTPWSLTGEYYKQDEQKNWVKAEAPAVKAAGTTLEEKVFDCQKYTPLSSGKNNKDPVTVTSTEKEVYGASNLDTEIMAECPFISRCDNNFNPRVDYRDAAQTKYAILITTNNSCSTNDFQSMKEALMSKGWSEDHISYFVLDEYYQGSDGNYYDDYASAEKFWDYLFPAASENKMYKSGNEVIIMMCSHGGDGVTNHCEMSLSDVNNFIDRLPCQRAVIINSCWSGKDIDTFADNKTMVLASTESRGYSYTTGRPESKSFFITKLAEGIDRKDTLEDAFEYASPLVTAWASKYISQDGPQYPQIYDNDLSRDFKLGARQVVGASNSGNDHCAWAALSAYAPAGTTQDEFVTSLLEKTSALGEEGAAAAGRGEIAGSALKGQLDEWGYSLDYYDGNTLSISWEDLTPGTIVHLDAADGAGHYATIVDTVDKTGGSYVITQDNYGYHMESRETFESELSGWGINGISAQASYPEGYYGADKKALDIGLSGEIEVSENSGVKSLYKYEYVPADEAAAWDVDNDLPSLRAAGSDVLENAGLPAGIYKITPLENTDVQMKPAELERATFTINGQEVSAQEFIVKAGGYGLDIPFGGEYVDSIVEDAKDRNAGDGPLVIGNGVSGAAGAARDISSRTAREYAEEQDKYSYTARGYVLKAELSNQSPLIEGVPSNAALTEGETFSAEIRISDNDNSDGFTSRVTVYDADGTELGWLNNAGYMMIGDGPDGMKVVLTDDGYKFAFTPGYDEVSRGQEKVYTVKVTAEDPTAVTEKTFSITVADTNTAPEFTRAPLMRESVITGQEITWTISANDSDDNVKLSAENLPEGAVFTDNGDGTATFTFTPDKAGEYQAVTLRAEEVNTPEGASVTRTFTLVALPEDAKVSGVVPVVSINDETGAARAYVDEKRQVHLAYGNGEVVVNDKNQVFYKDGETGELTYAYVPKMTLTAHPDRDDEIAEAFKGKNSWQGAVILDFTKEEGQTKYRTWFDIAGEDNTAYYGHTEKQAGDDREGLAFVSPQKRDSLPADAAQLAAGYAGIIEQAEAVRAMTPEISEVKYYYLNAGYHEDTDDEEYSGYISVTSTDGSFHLDPWNFEDGPTGIKITGTESSEEDLGKMTMYKFMTSNSGVFNDGKGIFILTRDKYQSYSEEFEKGIVATAKAAGLQLIVPDEEGKWLTENPNLYYAVNMKEQSVIDEKSPYTVKSTAGISSIIYGPGISQHADIFVSTVDPKTGKSTGSGYWLFGVNGVDLNKGFKDLGGNEYLSPVSVTSDTHDSYRVTDFETGDTYVKTGNSWGLEQTASSSSQDLSLQPGSAMDFFAVNYGLAGLNGENSLVSYYYGLRTTSGTAVTPQNDKVDYGAANNVPTGNKVAYEYDGKYYSYSNDWAVGDQVISRDEYERLGADSGSYVVKGGAIYEKAQAWEASGTLGAPVSDGVLGVSGGLSGDGSFFNFEGWVGIQTPDGWVGLKVGNNKEGFDVSLSASNEIIGNDYRIMGAHVNSDPSVSLGSHELSVDDTFKGLDQWLAESETYEWKSYTTDGSHYWAVWPSEDDSHSYLNTPITKEEYEKALQSDSFRRDQDGTLWKQYQIKNSDRCIEAGTILAPAAVAAGSAAAPAVGTWAAAHSLAAGMVKEGVIWSGIGSIYDIACSAAGADINTKTFLEHRALEFSGGSVFKTGYFFGGPFIKNSEYFKRGIEVVPELFKGKVAKTVAQSSFEGTLFYSARTQVDPEQKFDWGTAGTVLLSSGTFSGFARGLSIRSSGQNVHMAGELAADLESSAGSPVSSATEQAVVTSVSNSVTEQTVASVAAPVREQAATTLFTSATEQAAASAPKGTGTSVYLSTKGT